MTLPTTRVDPDLAALIRRVLAEHDCSPAADEQLWSRLTELGLADLTGGPERDGSGAGWWEAVELVGGLAGAGCKLPIGDSDLVAGWLCDVTGIAAGATLRIVWWDDGTDSHPAVHPLAQRMVVLRAGQVAEVSVESLHARLSTGAWESSIKWVGLDSDVGAEAELRLSLVRAVQISAAMSAATTAAIEHANVRVQFGRPLSKFQAIQSLLAQMSAETALTRAVVDAAVTEAVESTGATSSGAVGLSRLRSTVAVARSCAGHSAGTVARAAHQAIGAIGTTKEHRLHTYTMPMLAWRRDGMNTLAADRIVLADMVHGRLASDLNLSEPQVANSSRIRREL